MDTHAHILDTLPDAWIISLLDEHSTNARHRPSLRTMRQVLSQLAIRYRKRKNGAIYTDETLPQLARAMGIRTSAISTALTVLERGGWIVTLVRGGRGRGTMRRLPIVEYLHHASRNRIELTGECPRQLLTELAGEPGLSHGGTDRTHGASPRPPEVIHEYHQAHSASLDTASAERTDGRPTTRRKTRTDDTSASEAVIIESGIRKRHVPGIGWVPY